MQQREYKRYQRDCDSPPMPGKCVHASPGSKQQAYLQLPIGRTNCLGALNELHLGAGKFKHVAILQRYRICTNNRAIQRWPVCAFHMGNHKAMRPPGDGSNCHARFADSGHYFYQGHFPTRGSARLRPAE